VLVFASFAIFSATLGFVVGRVGAIGAVVFTATLSSAAWSLCFAPDVSCSLFSVSTLVAEAGCAISAGFFSGVSDEVALTSAVACSVDFEAAGASLT